MIGAWLLDTCVLSEVVKALPNGGVLQWLAQHQGQGCISVVTIAELSFGVNRLPQGRRRNQLQQWLGDIRTGFSDRILPTDEAVWIHFASLKADLLTKGKAQDDLDLLIAATAQTHGLTLVTRNTRHFQHTGVALVDPWT